MPAIKGMTREEVRQKRDNDVNKIINTIKDMGTCTYSELTVLTDMTKDRVHDLYKKYIRGDHPEFSTIKNPNGVVSFRYEEKKSIPLKTNGEGYNDPTMAKAIAKLENDHGMKYDLCAGEIWMDNSTVNAKYLILSCYKTNVNCLMVREMDNLFDSKSEVSFTIKGDEYYVAPYRVLSKHARSMTIKVCNTKREWFDAIKGAVASYLGLTMAEPIEKIVEKEVRVEVPKIVERQVEVPVEKIVYRDRPTTVNTELLEYKAKLCDEYQKVLFDILRNKSVENGTLSLGNIVNC